MEDSKTKASANKASAACVLTEEEQKLIKLVGNIITGKIFRDYHALQSNDAAVTSEDNPEHNS